MGKLLQLLLCSALLLQQNWLTSFVEAAPADQKTEQSTDVLSENNSRDVSASSVLGSLYRKSRQSRCVRCYEETSRNGDDRSRYYGAGGYSSRSVDDRASSNWYYPSTGSSYDRYEDRSRGSSDYDRYSASYYRDRDDRYTPRTYDRYEGRGGSSSSGGYDRYDDRRGGSSYDDRRGGSSYDDRRGGSSYEDRRGSYDRGGESRGYGYDSRDRGAYDRYYERARQGASSSYGNDRDRDYDRYYPRYDFRNYRPWDETYRGQSGFDNSGRGYYFGPSDDNSRRYLPEDRPKTQSQSPCGVQVPNCPYGNTQGTTTTVSSGPIDSGSQAGGSAGGYNTAINKNPGGGNNSGDNKNSWTYKNEKDESSRGDGGSRDRERDQQSSSYGGRPSRPLGGSYLFDRDSNNVIPEGQSNAAGAAEGNNVSSDKSGKDAENSVAVPASNDGGSKP